MITDRPPSTAASDFGLDSEPQTLSSTFAAYRSQLRSGTLGALPAVLAIFVLTLVFGLARPNTFLSLRNMANLTTQAAPVIVIAMAV